MGLVAVLGLVTVLVLDALLVLVVFALDALLVLVVLELVRLVPDRSESEVLPPSLGWVSCVAVGMRAA